MDWSEKSIEKLKKLYVETNITSDTLIKKKDLLSEFTQQLNSALTKNFFEEVASKLLTLRKSKKLPTLRR